MTESIVRRKVSRRELLKGFGAVAGMAVLAGCAPSAPGKAAQQVAEGEKRVKIRFWNWWGVARKPLMDAIIQQFESDYPWITVENVVQPWDRRSEKVLTAIAGGDPPEVIMAVRAEVLRFAAEGRIIPITEYVKRYNLDTSIFYPSEVNQFYWQGELYTMPMPTGGGLTGYVLYNKDLFAQAGLDPDRAPETWQEMEQAAKAITKKTEDGALEVIGANIGSSGANFVAWLYCNNGQFITDDLRTVTFNSPEGLDTLQWMLDFTNDINGGIENVTDFYQQTTGEAGQHPMYQGREGMQFPNVSIFFHIRNLAPDLNWGLGLRPYNGDNPQAESHGVAGLSFGWGYVIPTGLPKDVEEAAFLWVRRITAEKQGACRFMLEQARPSPIRECNEDPKYYDLNPAWDTVLEGLRRDVSLPMVPVHSQMMDFLNQAVQEVMYGEREPAEALDWAAGEAQRILDDFWSKQG